MRIAVIADVHGNCLALEAVLNDIAVQGIKEIVNLGDHVSGPLEAARTADLLVELYRQGSSTRGDFNQLGSKHFEWMASMPSTLVYRDEVFLCHAAPRDDA